MAKPQFLSPPQELKRKAVNFKTGFSVNLTDEITEKLEKTIAAKGDAFAIEVMDKLKSMRQTIKGVGADSVARMLMLPSVAEMALDIKGMGGTFGYPLLTMLAKSLHDFIGTLNMPTDGQFEVIRIHVDAMYVMLGQHVTGTGGTTEKTMLTMLSSAVNKVAEQVPN